MAQAYKTMRAKGQEVPDEVEPDNHIDELDPDLRYLWSIWCEVGAARTVNGMAPCPISFTDLLAWSHFHDVHLTSWEVTALQSIDTAWVIHNVKANKPKKHR